jgi:hypothetical protein
MAENSTVQLQQTQQRTWNNSRHTALESKQPWRPAQQQTSNIVDAVVVNEDAARCQR